MNSGKLPSASSSISSSAMSKSSEYPSSLKRTVYISSAIRCVTFRVSASFATSKRMTSVGVVALMRSSKAPVAVSSQLFLEKICEFVAEDSAVF